MRKLLLACAALAMARGAWACDICAVYTAMEAKEARPGIFAGVFEQYTDFGTLQLEGDEVENEANQYLHSSITQAYVGYQWARIGVQLNVPYIDRRFRRAEHDGVETGSVSGLGDVSVIAHARLYELLTETSFVTWGVTAGLELPTGDSDRLGEEAEEDHGEDHEGEHADLTTAPVVTSHPLPHGDEESASGVHGHDLALGSGSVDGILGTSLGWRHQRWLATASVEYVLRTEGDFDYRYADEVTWDAEAGYYVLLGHEQSLSVALRFSGEKKGEDTAAGEKADDTAIDAVYAGPELAYSRGPKLYADLAIEWPLRQENSGLQVVPDSRIRAGVTWRF